MWGEVVRGHGILTTTYEVNTHYYYCFCSTEGESKAQNLEIVCPRLYTEQAVKLGFEPRRSGFSVRDPYMVSRLHTQGHE